jgi:hypothetical protein
MTILSFISIIGGTPLDLLSLSSTLPVLLFAYLSSKKKPKVPPAV